MVYRNKDDRKKIKDQYMKSEELAVRTRFSKMYPDMTISLVWKKTVWRQEQKKQLKKEQKRKTLDETYEVQKDGFVTLNANAISAIIDNIELITKELKTWYMYRRNKDGDMVLVKNSKKNDVPIWFSGMITRIEFLDRFLNNSYSKRFLDANINDDEKDKAGEDLLRKKLEELRWLKQ